jgi:fluoride exporter
VVAVAGHPHPLRLSAIAAVAVGGVVGALLRWQLERSFPASDGGFPWTTFSINVSGSVLLALLPAVAFVRRHPLLPPALGTGVLGGFTTLSAYSEESRALVDAGHVLTAGAYVLGTLVVALAGVALADRLSNDEARAEFDDEEGDL